MSAQMFLMIAAAPVAAVALVAWLHGWSAKRRLGRQLEHAIRLSLLEGAMASVSSEERCRHASILAAVHDLRTASELRASMNAQLAVWFEESAMKELG